MADKKAKLRMTQLKAAESKAQTSFALGSLAFFFLDVMFDYFQTTCPSLTNKILCLSRIQIPGLASKVIDVNVLCSSFYLSDYDVTADHELQTYVSEISIDGKGPFGGAAQVNR